MPPFPPGVVWVGGPEPPLDRLVAARPVLVHFFDLAQLNSLRALDYVREWNRLYAGAGLALFGVHSPRFTFTRGAEEVEAALPRLEIDWPVAVDAELATWRAYGCEGWPSIFLWGRGGGLRWYHLGEGEYDSTEEEIRRALDDDRQNGEWPSTLQPLRPSDAPGAGVIPPTPELFPGGSISTPWTAGAGDPVIELDYAAASVHAAIDGSGELAVTVDGGEARPVSVEHPGLHQLVAGELHAEHHLRIEASGSLSIHSIQFAPGPPFRP